MDNYLDKPMDNLENKQPIDKNTPIWLKTWIFWLARQYGYPESEHNAISEIITQLFNELEIGNSAYSIDAQDIQPLSKACLYPEKIANEHHNALPEKQSTLEEKLNFYTAQSSFYPFVYENNHLMLYRHWYWEKQLANKIVQLAQQKFPFSEEKKAQLLHFQQILDTHSQDESQKQDDLQKNALQKAIMQGFTLITGGPGTGKTYILAQIIAILTALDSNIRIAMAAPTGKAAQRMQEALQNSLSKLPNSLKNENLTKQQTMTLHRLLGLGFSSKPRFHSQNPLPYDVIVIDESSMLSLELAHLLFNAIPKNCRVILLGDAHQLASVDIGSVLSDLQNMPLLQNNRQTLEKSRRFPKGSPIGQLATLLQGALQSQQHGDSENLLQKFTEKLPNTTIEIPNDSLEETEFAQMEYINQENEIYYQPLAQGFRGYADALKKHWADLPQLYDIHHQPEHPDYERYQNTLKEICDAFDKYRILTATQKGNFGVEKLNHFMENWLKTECNIHSKYKTWYLGKAVIITQNDYQLGLSNGDIGLCLSQDSDSFKIYFPSLKRWFTANRLPDNLQQAFAMTIHKSQGSEFTLTAVVLDENAERLLSLELIYTAITRAKKSLILLTTPKALALSLSQKTQRISQLVYKVNQMQ